MAAMAVTPAATAAGPYEGAGCSREEPPQAIWAEGGGGGVDAARLVDAGCTP